MKFLNAEMIRAGRNRLTNPVFCTLENARQRIDSPNYKLGTLANRLGFRVVKEHDAAYDASLAAQLFGVISALDRQGIDRLPESKVSGKTRQLREAPPEKTGLPALFWWVVGIGLVVMLLK